MDPTPSHSSSSYELECNKFRASFKDRLPEFEQLKLIAENAVFSAGNAIRDLGGESAPTVKDDDYVGNRAIVTRSDFRSQEAIFKVFERLLGEDPRYCFITEEETTNPAFRNRIITRDTLDTLRNKIVFVIDELDGTWKHKSRHHDWSVSIGAFAGLKHVAGAVYAPKIDGGSLYSASLMGGASLKTSSAEVQIKVSETKSLKDAAVCFGVDCALFDNFLVQSNLLREVGNEAGQCDMCGSSALALCLVAAGKLDALVQPPQRAWDWAAGKLIVEEASGKVILYKQEGNKIIRLDNTTLVVDREILNPEKRSVGFVAGPEALAEELFERLVRLSLS